MSSVKRETINGRRYYKIEGVGLFPSVTTILKSTTDRSGLNKWKKRIGHKEAKRIGEEAADRGTVMHRMIELFLSQDLSINKRDRFKRVLDTCRQDKEIKEFDDLSFKRGVILFNNLYRDDRFFPRIKKVIFQEKYLWSTFNGGFAGTVDNFSLLIDDSYKIIDFKTAKKPKQEEWIDNYKIQAAAYSIAIWERTNMKPNGAEIWISNEETDKPQIFELTFDDIKLWFEIFSRKVKQYHDNYGYLINDQN